jgi:hypothetical protein
MAIFQTDLNAAMAFKGTNPETTIFVSLEHSHTDHDSFWSSPAITSVISVQTIVLRLTESETPTDFAQFRQIFQIDSVPSLTVFGRNSALVTKTWDEYPSVDEFLAFLRPPPPRLAAAAPPIDRPQTIKISLRGRSATISKEFTRTATIGELKAWLAAELGADFRVVVSPSQRPLPADDRMTLVEADLAPSAVLHALSGDVIDGEIVIDPPRAAPRQTREPVRCCTGGAMGRVRKYAVFVFSLINPWAVDDEEERFLEYRPNPQLLRDIRRSARMMQRMQRMQERRE